ncbi:DUF6236 family protein [Klebsiella michiganensis]
MKNLIDLCMVHLYITNLLVSVYGVIKRANMQNKIVLFPNGMISGDTLHSFGGLTAEDIARSVLYWDKIAILENNFINIEIFEKSLENSLFSAGIIERHVIQMPSVCDSVMPVLHKLYSDKAFELLNRKDSNYATYGMEGFLKENNTNVIQNSGEIVTLTNSLPLPDKITPMDEILGFREKRKGELRNLITHLNSLENRVASSENQSIELKKAINEIDIACATIIRLFNESKIKFTPSSIDYNFNMKEIFKVASMYYARGFYIPASNCSSNNRCSSWCRQCFFSKGLNKTKQD